MQSNNTTYQDKNQTTGLHMPFFTTMALFLVLCDAFMMFGAWFLALLLRFDFRANSIPAEIFAAYAHFIIPYVALSLVVFALLRLYRNIWRFASYTELNRLLIGNLITGVFHIIGITVLEGRMPVSYYLVGFFAQLGLTTAIRFGYRFINLERKRLAASKDSSGKRVMIIGGGDAGHILIREMNTSNELNEKPCCIIDDDSSKWGSRIEGVPVVGGRNAISESARKYSIDEIYFAIPSISAQQRKSILDIAGESGCKIKVVPGIYQLINGDVSVEDMKPVEIEDLLGREPVKINMDEIYHFIKGKTILVTGGGGSIGSELCRQIAAHEPKELIIFDIYENNAYEIQQELIRKYGHKLNLSVLIGSVRDSRRMDQIFGDFRPEIVFHAAAHKHVPLMEENPCEAVKNNCMGTYKTAVCALRYGVERFVLISTDKAVNPTNVMGASKRVCEMIIQSMDMISREGHTEILPSLGLHAWDTEEPRSWGEAGNGIYPGGEDEDCTKKSTGDQSLSPKACVRARCGAGAGVKLATHEVTGDSIETHTPVESDSAVGMETHPRTALADDIGRHRTQFVAVRFGNVLGSNGSVVPLFKEQIREGGPVTVTHPDIVRYFMTIPEAVSLVMQAGVYAAGGEIFVLDMGEPIKIDTLARNLIKLSGMEPDIDIPIVYTGLRPGEKLYEERLMAEEGLEKTANDLIYIGKPVEFEVSEFMKELGKLSAACYANDEADMVSLLEECVPTFKHMDE